MIKKVVHTLVSKGLIAVLNFSLLLFTTRYLGAEIRGNISILILSIALVSMINEMVGGPALVYYIAQKKINKLLQLSYLWAFISAIGGTLTLYYLNLFPRDFVWQIMFVCLLQCIVTIHTQVLIGNEKIQRNNFLSLMLPLTNNILFIVLFFFLGNKTVLSYVNMLIGSYSFCVLMSIVFIQGIHSHGKLEVKKTDYFTLFKNGFIAQSATISGFLSMRIAYYLVGFFVSIASLGIYSTGIAVAESVSVISASISLVLYSKVANTQGGENAIESTLLFAKISTLLTLPLVLILLCLPYSFYALVFGSEFIDMKKVIICYSPGILSLSFSTVLIHYYSGVGKFKISAIAALISLTISVVLGWLYIPTFHLIGAALSASIALIVACFFTSFIFVRESNITFRQLLMSKNDWKKIISLVK